MKDRRPFFVHLNKTGSFSSGAFFLQPDKESNKLLTKLMEDFHQNAPQKIPVSSTTPHLSIARRLNKEKVQIAAGLIKEVKIQFECTGLFIRTFDAQKK